MIEKRLGTLGPEVRWDVLNEANSPREAGMGSGELTGQRKIQAPRKSRESRSWEMSLESSGGFPDSPPTPTREGRRELPAPQGFPGALGCG